VAFSTSTGQPAPEQVRLQSHQEWLEQPTAVLMPEAQTAQEGIIMQVGMA